MVSLRRPAGLLAAVTALALAPTLERPSPATADTARISTFAGAAPRERTIAVTAPDGTTTTVGRFRVWRSAFGLTRSPDGDHFAALIGRWSFRVRELMIVPTDGGRSFAIPLAVGSRRFAASPEDIAWTTDGRALIVGSANRTDGTTTFAVLRCALATRDCRELSHVQGLAAPLGRGLVASTSTAEGSSWVRGLEFDDEDLFGAASIRGFREPQLSRTVLSTRSVPTPGSLRTVWQRRASLVDGREAATDVIGGRRAALIVRSRERVQLRRTPRGVRGRSIAGRDRWTLLRADGHSRTVVAPELTVPAAHSAPRGNRGEASRGRIESQRDVPQPRAATATGGWLATTGWPADGARRGGLVLTAISPRGRAAFVRVGGSIASATELVRVVLGRTPTPGTPGLEVIGHEAATNAAIVTLRWTEDPPPKRDTLPGGSLGPDEAGESREPVRGEATVRVPLDGHTPPSVVVDGPVQAAW